MNSTLKKILIFVLILAVIIVILVLVFGKKPVNKDLQDGGVLNTTQSPIGEQSQKFLQSLSQVRSITLDTTLFKDPAYQKLKDLTLPITLEDTRLIGRPNPFAPLGVDTIFNAPENQVELNVSR